jgi:hypothetical protein
MVVLVFVGRSVVPLAKIVSEVTFGGGLEDFAAPGEVKRRVGWELEEKQLCLCW